ncbi:glycoside hydrolase family 29 protein [Athelia psychrophila]|uniref:alpha-L-fucosidase n=1 Tax=Athelia psychrophila TaxID=1759441 RepID=A0A166RKX9_9AGAM|nr:glycoside hydrolase family 29 protein [Fibularhizoctonia sp. CBS 109695]
MSVGIHLQEPFSIVSGSLHPYPSLSLPINHLFNNQAASKSGHAHIADFDGQGASYDAQFLPNGSWVYDSINYDLPSAWGLRPDNILADSQKLDLAENTYAHELHLVYAGDGIQGASEAKFQLTFEDDSSETIQLSAKNWFTRITLNVGAIQTPYHYVSNGDTNWNTSNIFQWSTSIPSKAKLKSITLPPKTSSNRLHIFSVSLTPSITAADLALSIRRARFTTRWEDVLGVKAQVVEITLANLAPESQSLSRAVTSPMIVHVIGGGATTIKPGMVNRLMGSDQARVEVLVLGVGTSGGDASVLITDIAGKVLGISEGWPVSPPMQEWTTDAAVLGKHETPSWFNQAKFGIFIHWGPYSVPAWGPPWAYAEWYDWSLHSGTDSNNPTWKHHLETFGKDVVYDDFIANFTGSHFNASEWLDLFDDAGAKYFVLTTKHHDGYALWDTGNTSNRNSVKLGPKRDFLAELFETAKKEKPDMHRGTYFSMPEWFSPDYARYGFDDWPGGLAHNVFNSSEVEPYTGRLDIDDYLQDLQLPQMLDLAENYDTEIMWCDISSANLTLDFAARFYNHAAQDGRQVVMNDRCGNVPDFDTPEYSTFGSIQTRKWETSEGMDPWSYGLNTATPPGNYKNGTVIIHTLVDVASKNGNYLLDVGPDAAGRIIEPMVTNLLEAGKWLKHSGECVYGTDYWFKGSEDAAGSVRFLTTPETFCIVALTRPENGQLIMDKQLPIVPGDSIFLLSPRAANGHEDSADSDAVGLPWSINETTGAVTINVTEDQLGRVDHAWAFKVVYGLMA